MNELLHAQGPRLSRIVTGVWRWQDLSFDTVERLINTSIDVGITSFDHADIYGDHSCEELFGSVLKTQPTLRSQTQLITKCGIKFSSSKRPQTWIKHYDTSEDHIICSAENSLKMLATDYLDLLLLHRPDPLLNPHEVASAFQKLKNAGKVLHFGVSNFTPSQFEMLQSFLPFPLVTNQIEISLSQIDPLFNGDLDSMMKHRVSPMAWSPLGGGKLHFEEHDWLTKTTQYNASHGQLALAWLLKHPSHIFPIVGTTKPERIVEAAKSTHIVLDKQDWFEMLKWSTKRDVA